MDDNSTATTGGCLFVACVALACGLVLAGRVVGLW
jgi:hypothetical protein